MKRQCEICKKTSAFTLRKNGKITCVDCASSENVKKREVSHEEEDMQIEFFSKSNILFPKIPEKALLAVPNGGKRNIKEAARLKRQGVRAGASDILLLIPNNTYPYLCIELKTDSGTQSDNQIEFEKQINKVGGLYVICRSIQEIIDTITNYLRNTIWL